ncbi:phage integrase N-terminal SAM-like domain-containing protein [Acidovorax sp. ACV02]|uniref:phage integrase N-terminal SAM-like domain-containing protein n=1 Tax=Acidovorax sp. ACV02 TaxID=2769310 RepID=UPI00351CA5E8
MLRATRLQDQVRVRNRYKHYSLLTQRACARCVRMFVKWHRLRHPRDMGQQEIEGCPTIWADERRVAAAMLNQVLSAQLFPLP